MLPTIDNHKIAALADLVARKLRWGPGHWGDSNLPDKGRESRRFWSFDHDFQFFDFDPAEFDGECGIYVSGIGAVTDPEVAYEMAACAVRAGSPVVIGKSAAAYAARIAA